MNAKSKLLIGAGAGLIAAAGFAMPASAQYYPSRNYGYGYNNSGDAVLGAIIRGVLGAGNYGRYPYGNYGYGQQGYMNERTAVDQCARVVEDQINRRTNAAYGSRYGNYGSYGTYGQRYGTYDYNYGNRYGQARIAGITSVDRKSYGLRVKGVAMSGQYATRYGSYGRTGYGYGQRPDLKWNCEIDRYGRIRDLDIERR
ncbi:hypothetical protein [Sphingomicrobium nitratireducens]|uniref:hypothetical protein n=1 Tax=Sphingomicrobium nitratireducens TaxID=2964666 RepID=UPI00223F174F|nr:hypothetical protein [Sphingomicrobium nitratireducens]